MKPPVGVYPLLARLKAEQKVTTEWVDTGVGHAHKYYELTDKGRATLKGMLIAWRDFGAAFEQLMSEK